MCRLVWTIAVPFAPKTLYSWSPGAYFNLRLSTPGKIFSRQRVEVFFLFQKTGFDISCRLSLMETISCHILHSGKVRKKITNLLSAELAKRVVMFNMLSANM